MPRGPNDHVNTRILRPGSRPNTRELNKHPYVYMVFLGPKSATPIAAFLEPGCSKFLAFCCARECVVSSESAGKEAPDH